MASLKLIPDDPFSAHPQAATGYGKRCVAGEEPGVEGEFGHLRPREASIAHYLDQLAVGADLSVKTLAKELPYGQCALRTALRLLSEAGHLRRVREHVNCESGGRRWVTRTYFSRMPRSDAWWASFRAGERTPSPSVHTGPAPPQPATDEGPPSANEPADQTTSAHSDALLRRAYGVLAGLGRQEFRMSLSGAACQELAPLAAQWLERGADERQLTHALLSSLPLPIYHAGRFARRRLITHLPPPLPAASPDADASPDAASAAVHGGAPRPPLRLLECTVCQTPGRPDALPGGICRECRNEPVPRPRVDSEQVRAHAQRVREAAGLTRARRTTRSPQDTPSAPR